MKKYSIILFLLLISCASYNKNIRHIKANPNEITQFKLYLEKYYSLNKFEKYETIWGTYKQNDTVIFNFCRKNNIISIVKLPGKDSDHYYNQYGNIVSLKFNHIHFFENNQDVIFDYTEKGLENYDKRFTKRKVAERIYIFR